MPTEAHKLKAAKPNVPHCVRSSLETVPAEQEVQEAAPVCSVIVFSGHLVQIVTESSLYVPALHSTEEVQKIKSHDYTSSLN